MGPEESFLGVLQHTGLSCWGYDEGKAPFKCGGQRSTEGPLHPRCLKAGLPPSPACALGTFRDAQENKKNGCEHLRWGMGWTSLRDA